MTEDAFLARLREAMEMLDELHDIVQEQREKMAVAGPHRGILLIPEKP